jgi:carboxyl-terminal processing protease
MPALRVVLTSIGLLFLSAATARAQDETAAPVAATNAAAAAVQKVSDRDASYDDIAVLTEAILLVQRNYVEEEKFRDLIYGAVDGMLSSLDPHSAFLPPEAFDALREETAGSFSGIGVTVGIRDGVIVVIAPIEDSPAFRAGLHAGDRIVAIDGQSNRGTTMNEAVGKLRGPRGSTVKLTIERDDREPFDAVITRDDVRVASVRGTRIVRDDVGYIRVNVFSEQTPVEFEAAFRKVLALKATALVLDLRDNPGGLLDAAVAVAEKLLPDKAVIVTTRGRDGVRNEEQFRAGGTLRNASIPVVVLVNRGSASASEIVAGALQDHRRAVVLGETSFGKASVQNVVRLRLRPECAVRLTTAHYFTPQGRMIHGKGITPDVAVAQTPGEWRKVQLKRLYAEAPDSYPASAREAVGNATDVPLERAVDLLIGARILDGKK